MSTRSQKRKAGVSVEETEDNQQENLLRVSSVVVGEDVSSEPSTSTNGLTPQVDQSLENLKTSLRKEITEEVKTLLEQSQRELILAIRSSSLENRPSNSDEIIETPTSVTLTPTKTVRFGNVNSPVSIRNHLSFHYRVNNTFVLYLSKLQFLNKTIQNESFFKVSTRS